MPESTVTVNRDIRAERMAAAKAFQSEMANRGTLIVRLLSSPGAGKTTLLQKTAERLADKYAIGVLVGDVETERDAERLAPFAPTKQITTGGACHLELPLVKRALPHLGDQTFDFLFIEDVGNLICPASHDLGEHLRVLVLSTTEGDDKPGKYPKAFRTSQTVVISKLDLLEHVPFSIDAAKQDALSVQPDLEVLSVCALTGAGMDSWCAYLEHRRKRILNSDEADGRMPGHQSEDAE